MDPVEGQLEAYNCRDLERFLPYFSECIVVEDGFGTVLLRNIAEFGDRYASMFLSYPELHCKVVNRMRVGRYAVDEEMIYGRGPEPIHCIVCYRLSERLDVIEHIKILK